MPRVIGVIPARMDSTRLPGKMLADLNGKPLIQHTYENARKAEMLNDLMVATDSEEIRSVVEGFGGQVVMTSQECRCGTERVAEAVEQIECDIVVNIQGDEAFIPHELVKLVVETFRGDRGAVMGTVARKITDAGEYRDRNVVKVVINRRGRAMYFSRAPIPHSKSGEMVEGTTYYHHIGIYSCGRGFLLGYPHLPVTALERSEGLEQLRTLENGYQIAVGITDLPTLKIDTPEDLDRARKGAL